jgi:hypothetical protein
MDLATIVDLADVKPIAEQVGKGADPEGNPAPDFPIQQGPGL